MINSWTDIKGIVYCVHCGVYWKECRCVYDRMYKSITGKQLEQGMQGIENTMDQDVSSAFKKVYGTSVVKDNVNSPQHYNHNWKGIECIDAIEASMSPVEFLGALKANVMKYTWRYAYKNGLEDLKKSEWYKKKLIDKFEEYKSKGLITVDSNGINNAYGRIKNA